MPGSRDALQMWWLQVRASLGYVKRSGDLLGQRSEEFLAGGLSS